MNDHSVRGLMAGWQKLITAVETFEVELPEVGLDLARRRRQVTREAREQKAECSELALRLRSLILAHFGPRDERLAAFGIKLARGRVRTPARPETKNGSPGCH